MKPTTTLRPARPFAGPVGLLLLALCLGACAGPNALSSASAADAQAPDPLLTVQGAQLFEEGQALAQRGDYVRAEQYLAAAIRRGYPAERALPLLLRVCISASRLGSALQHASPYLQLHPEDYRLRWLVASVLVGLGRYDEARLELARVLRDAPDHAPAHYMLGVLLRDHYGDADAAAVQFAAYERLAADGLHGAEVTAWLREREQAPVLGPRLPAAAGGRDREPAGAAVPSSGPPEPSPLRQDAAPNGGAQPAQVSP